MPVEVDVKVTPLAGVSQASSVVASVAHKFGSATARLSILRYDEKDAPTPRPPAATPDRAGAIYQLCCASADIAVRSTAVIGPFVATGRT